MKNFVFISQNLQQKQNVIRIDVHNLHEKLNLGHNALKHVDDDDKQDLWLVSMKEEIQ